MLRTMLLALVALAGISGAAQAQTLTLPQIGIQNSGACRQLAVKDPSSTTQVPMGCVDTTSKLFRSTPNALKLPVTADPTSGGDISPFSVNGAVVGQQIKTKAGANFQDGITNIYKNGFGHTFNDLRRNIPISGPKFRLIST